MQKNNPNALLSLVQTAVAYWQCVFLYNIKKRIYTCKLSGQKKKSISPYSVPFLFSTENLIDTYRAVSPSGKNVLTIAASGDHAFDAYFHGAHHVETFDYNQWQECVLRLKTDLIHHMNYNQFMNFFTAINNRQMCQSYDILSPIIPYLTPKAKILVDKFYDSNTNTERFFQISPFFWTNDGHYKQNKIGYLESQSAFNKLKTRLPEQIDFTLADADTIAQNLHQEYDIIHLSNIMDYYSYSKTNNPYENAIRFYNNVLRQLFHHLSNNGTMIMHYDWGDADFEYPNYDIIDCHCYKIITNYLGLFDDMFDPEMHFRSACIPAIQPDINNDTLWMLQKLPQKTR